MQRKNNILNRVRPKYKSGMAMIMAITLIIILATIMALSLALSSQTIKRTNDLYLSEQSALIAKSAAEYALLRISLDNNETNPCNYTQSNFKQDYYDVNISVKYSYKNPPASCNGKTFATVTTDEQNGSILLDVTVSVTDGNITTEPIRYFRRSIQKL
jgi:type II secretory pathway pseudopilin PulG